LPAANKYAKDLSLNKNDPDESVKDQEWGMSRQKAKNYPLLMVNVQKSGLKWLKVVRISLSLLS
jgi:hypothetical protein